ncbi:MAG TPA: hypothetical protein VHE35_31535 [Kofleriaceae bacterium]|nr:hypothetical protein [Kofleriaceae bacterium]
MTRKQITGVRLNDFAPATGWEVGHIERLTWLEDGKSFPHEEPREQIARAVNAGEPYYVRTPDGREVDVKAHLRHGKYFLSAVPGAGEPDLLLALPVHRR